MATYSVTTIIDGQPCFDKPLDEILGTLRLGGGIKTLDPVEFITDRQRRWYKGVCLPWLVKHDENRESSAWWDDEVKRKCNGLDLLKKQIFFTQSIDGQKWPLGRLTTRGVGKKNMTAFIEEILAMSVTENWGIAPPDKDLRSKK